MGNLKESIKDLSVHSEVDSCNISIGFSRLEEHISDTDHYLTLFSKVDYKSDQFEWVGEVETVHIPFKDDSVGYLVNGSIRSTIGVYQRAPGPVLRDEKKDTTQYRELDIITNANGKLTISEEKNGIFITLGSGGKIPIGVFLKAIADMPYQQILKQIAYKPKELRNSFPPIISDKNSDLAKLAAGAPKGAEPSLEECVDAVYTAMLSSSKRDSVSRSGTTFHYKHNRIKTYISSLNYKNQDNIESKLSIGHRAVGSQLVDGIDLPVFAPDGSITSFFIPKGTHINDKHAREIRRHDITQLRIKFNRIVTIQDVSSMYFRVLGYKLGENAAGYVEGTYIDEDVLRDLNDTEMLTLKVITPNGTKTVTRNNDKVSYTDFITVLNYYLTAPSTKTTDSSEYAISNRIIVSFENTIINTIMQVYNDIANSLIGVSSIKDLLSRFKDYPNTQLMFNLISSVSKEITQPDLTNLLAKETTERKSSTQISNTPLSMQFVQSGQYGRLDSLHAPQSDKVGSVHQLTVMAKLKDGTGEILAPYEKVVNGKPTGEVEYITAAKEKNKYIAEWNNPMVDAEVNARINGDITVVGRQQVDYREVSPFLDMSLSRSLVPFPDYSQPKRSLMATTHQCQSIPLLKPERALVTTGADTEVPFLYYTGRDLLEMYGIEPNSGDTIKIIKTDWTKNSADYRFAYGSNFFVHRSPCIVSDKETLYMYRLNVKEKYEYSLDDIIFYYFSTDLGEQNTWELNEQGIMPFVKNPKKPAIALGKNLRIGFKTAASSTIEDAVLISKRLVNDDTLTSIQIFKYQYKLKADEKMMHYDAVSKLHTWVSSGSPVISVMKSNGNIKNIDAFISGEVIYTDTANDEITVYVATYHRAELGDKVAGRYGNKSVIARIVDEEMMPYDTETGESLDMCLSPLGLPSRMNYGQLLEVAIGAVMKQENKIAVITPYYPNSKERIIEKCNEHGLRPKRLYLPHCNKYTERPIMTGIMYILKLEQIANLKASAVGYPVSVDPVFGQPTASDNDDKGQKIGEMETWALGACGMNHLLDDFFSLYVDDAQLRAKYFDVLNDGEDGPWDETKESLKANRSPARNSLVVQSIIRSLGLDLETDDDKFRIVPIDMSKISTVVSKNTLLQHSDSQWTKIALQSPVVSPFWLEKMSTFNLVLGVPSISYLLNESNYINMETLECVDKEDLPSITRAGYITGIDAITYILNTVQIGDAIKRLTAIMKDMEEKRPNEAATADTANLLKNDFVRVKQTRELLLYLESNGYNLDIFVLSEFPVLPGIFRQSTRNSSGKQVTHTFNKKLTSILNAVYSKDIYNAIKDFIGYSSDDEKTTSIANFFMGSGADGHGRTRDSVLSKRIGFSGRSVIVPMSDMTTSPFFIGVPWYIAMTIYDRLLSLKFMRRAEMIDAELAANSVDDVAGKVIRLSNGDWIKIITSLWEFNYTLLSQFISSDRDTCMRFYSICRRYAKEFIEGKVNKYGFVEVDGKYVDPDTLPLESNVDASVVVFGRQPTLHKKSIRAFYVKLVDGWSIHIHPLVCSAYNADFDGDSMWLAACFGESKVEALHNMLIDKDLIADKDGSFTLGLTQDICLGLYCMTTYKDNTEKYVAANSKVYMYSNLSMLRTDVEYGSVNYYDTVLYRHSTGNLYLSTAGRMLVNSVLPNAFTDEPFTDKHGIAASKNISVTEKFKDLRFDTIIASRDQPSNLKCSKIDAIMEYVYESVDPKSTVSICQELYELGLSASDSYGVSISLDDISVETSFVDDEMEIAQKKSNEASLLYHMGIITLEENRMMSHSIWDDTKKNAQKAIMKSIKPDSNLYYMLYSGARGNPGQIMQTVGFIGTIQKTQSEDIEHPILHGYGNGLTSFDISQTLYSARIGVVSSQSSTKDTGYATRQAAYAVMGDTIVEDDCGIDNSFYDVQWSNELTLIDANGNTYSANDFIGKTITEHNPSEFAKIAKEVYLSSYVLDERVLTSVLENNANELVIDGVMYKVVKKLTNECRTQLLGMYSYALPGLTEEFGITEKSLAYIEKYGLDRVVALKSNEALTDLTKLEEAYMAVDYDSEQYVAFKYENGQEQKVEAGFLLSMRIMEDSEDYYKYSKLLTDDRLNLQALKYITEHNIHSVHGSEATIYFRYKIRKLFRNLLLNRLSGGLPYLDEHGTITSKTLDIIENEQIPFVPVRTGFTCKSVHGMCSKCYGLTDKDKHFKKTGTNIGISAIQSMCESVTQTTLNTTHNAGMRKGNLVNGVDFFRNLLQGSSATQADKKNGELEVYAPCSAFVNYEPLNKDIVSLVDLNGTCVTRQSGGYERWAVPNGAFIEKGEVLISGKPNFQRYASKDIFISSLKTRYLLVTLYNIIFSDSGIDISPRNFEVLSRAQTSQVYLVDPVELEPIKDTSEEISDKTGHYMLIVSNLNSTIHKFTGIGFLGFERFNDMFTQAILFPEHNKMSSIISNFFTGTKVGSSDITFKPSLKKEYKKNKARKSTIVMNDLFSDTSDVTNLFGDLFDTPIVDDFADVLPEEEQLDEEFDLEPNEDSAEEQNNNLRTMSF